MSCRHRWVEKDWKGQVCTKCKAERGPFLPGKKKPQWFKQPRYVHSSPESK